MITVTAKEAKNRLGEVLRTSMREPVEITHHGKPIAYVVSQRSFPEARTGFTPRELDRIKHQMACEIVTRFDLAEIRRHSLQNLDRWRDSGVTSHAYDEWRHLLESGTDREVLAVMVGSTEDGNRLRQSPPYVGMLEKGTLERIREESST
jgi:prevent-host-death family protein